MSIASEIYRLQTAKAGLKTAIEGKGVTVPSSATLEDYPDYVDAIQAGGGQEVPSDYDQLDYVYFTGTQYINTGYTWNANSEFIIENIRYVQGMDNFSEILKATNLYCQYGYSTGCYIKIGSMSEINIASNNVFIQQRYSKLKIKISATTANVYGICPDVGPATAEYTTTVGTTGEVTLSNSDRPWCGLVMSFEVKENGTSVLRMLPAKRKSDDVIGMYDVVRNQFYTDASGNGLAGGDFAYVG